MDLASSIKCLVVLVIKGKYFCIYQSSFTSLECNSIIFQQQTSHQDAWIYILTVASCNILDLPHRWQDAISSLCHLFSSQKDCVGTRLQCGLGQTQRLFYSNGLHGAQWNGEAGFMHSRSLSPCTDSVNQGAGRAIKLKYQTVPPSSFSHTSGN